MNDLHNNQNKLIKVLWVINTPFNALSMLFDQMEQVYGGWLEGAYEGIKDYNNIELTICFPRNQKDDLVFKSIEKTNIYAFKLIKNKSNLGIKKYSNYFKKIIDITKPDLVHIWGTEFFHSEVFAKVFENPSKVIISIQGLMSYYYKNYYAGLNTREMCTFSFRDLIKIDTIPIQKYKYYIRSKSEINAIKNVSNIIGRTDWDKACSRFINPSVNYFSCNEILRSSFYKNGIDERFIDENSIFVSQSNYPIKGFHVLLKAVSLLKNKYSNIKVYTTGIDVFNINPFRVTTYQKIIRKMIIKYDLKDNIVFLGKLNETVMVNQYLKSKIFVSASAIENSPNSIGEAKILGVPVIASDVGGVRNMIEHGKDGFLFPFNEYYMLAYYIDILFENNDIYNHISKNSVISSSYMHSKKVNTERLINIYMEIYNKDTKNL